MYIKYQAIGDPVNSSILLISGLGEQMVAWPDEFCVMLAEAGFYVIRFDNRDTGRSTKLGEKGFPDLNAAWQAYLNGEFHLPPPTEDAQNAMATPPPQTKNGYIDHMVNTFRVFSGGSNIMSPTAVNE